jgi:hypothetical protein
VEKQRSWMAEAPCPITSCDPLPEAMVHSLRGGKTIQI